METLAFTLVLVNCDVSSAQPGPKNGNQEMEGCPLCRTRGGGKCCELSSFKAQMPFNPSRCCGGAVSEYFQSSQFENIFSKRNSLEAHAVSFWNYQSFVTASAQYQSYGFGTTYWKLMGMKEVAAFLAHVASKTSCEFRVSVLWSLIWAFVLSVWSNICVLRTYFLPGFDFIGFKWIWGFQIEWCYKHTKISQLVKW